MRRPDPTLEAGLRELQIRESLQDIAYHPDGRARPFEERTELLVQFKDELKKRYRQLARELHPDLNGDLVPEERQAREDRLKAVGVAVDFAMGLEVARPRPAPQRMMVRVVVVGYGYANSATATSSSTTGGWWGTW